MDKAFFEQLLYESESNVLDFKKQQYPFSQATDSEKSEILKDILGFANASRRSEAFIIIGVEEIKGERSNVVGISSADHLADSSLQQFINSLTNRPIQFRYEAFSFDEKQVGIIRIEQQIRPIFLKRDFGKLKKNEVYVRRGSSTDPSHPALPDEIATMTASAESEPAQLVVEFADVEKDNSLGSEISWDAERCIIPPENEIPDFRHHSIDSDFGGRHTYDLYNRVNRNYYRDLANYHSIKRLFRPVRLVIKNIGSKLAHHVRCEFEISANTDIRIMKISELPFAPRRRGDILDIRSFRERDMNLKYPNGHAVIQKNNERYKIEIDCGDIQPGRSIWSNVFFLGKSHTGNLRLAGRIYAGNLPEPKECNLVISVVVSEFPLSLSALVIMSEPVEEKIWK